jgi:acyl-CoA oxidase
MEDIQLSPNVEHLSSTDLELYALEFRPGPLSDYRNGATFCWRRFRILFQRRDELEMKYKIWNAFENDPTFDHPIETLSLKDYRSLTFKRVKRILELNLSDPQQFMKHPSLYFAWVGAVGMYNWSLLARKTLLYDFVVSNLMGAGTEKHLDIIPDLMEGKFGGCFCLTEISHGSDTQSMRTTATFIKETDEFEINTPDFEAAKTWVGNLGETATHASVFAQLITENGKK